MIKPEFFDDPLVGELSFAARLCFIGLWTQADREGRLECEAERLKARLFPFDDVNLNVLLNELCSQELIHIYHVDGRAYACIRNFSKHQHPHPHESNSVIPLCSSGAVTCHGEPCHVKPIRILYTDPVHGSCTRNLKIGEERESAAIADSPPSLATPSLLSAITPSTADGVAVNCPAQHPGLMAAATPEGPSTALQGAPSGADDGAGPQRRLKPTEEFLALWNATTCPPIPRSRELTAKRTRHIAARLAERPLGVWQQIFARIQASRFCRGDNDRGWCASFDWIIRSPDVGLGVLEGKYDDRRRPRGSSPLSSAGQSTRTAAERVKAVLRLREGGES